MGLLCLLLIGATLIAQVLTRPEHTQAATNETINFQARLLTAAGSLVADGNYNVEFKLYAAASGGSALWTETRTTTNRVRVVNGYLTVNLGSVTAFPSNIDWDQELWMTMNIGGITETPDWDGEMTPRLKLTSVPFAKRASQLAGGSGANRTVLDTGTPSGNNLLHLPAESGTLCVRNSSLCGFMTGAPADYIQNQLSSDQTANFRISGSGQAGSFRSFLFDTPSAGVLNIGASSTGINLNQATTVTGYNFTVSGGLTTLNGASTGDALSVNNTTSLGNIAVFRDNGVAIATFADGGVVTFQNSTNTANALMVKTVSGTNVINVDTTNQQVTIGSNTSTNRMQLVVNQAGTADTGMEFKNTNVSYYAGIDTSAGDIFKISSSSAGGTAILGYNPTNGGGSTDSDSRNFMAATMFTAPSTGTITTINAHVGAVVGGSPNNQGQAAIYSNNSGTPGARLGTTPNITLTPNSWNTYTLSSPVNVTAGTVYWLVTNNNGTTTAHNNLTYDGGTLNQTKWSAQTFGSWPANWGTTNFQDSWRLAMYATINVSSSSDPLNNGLFSLTASGQALFKNNSDSATAFQVQNAAGNQLLTVDTTGNQVILGKASTVNGKMVFQNATNANTVTLQTGTTAGSYTLTLPTALGASGSCLKDTTGAGVLGFGTCGSDLQAAYTASTSPEIVLNSTNGALTIRDAASSVGTLLEVQNNAGSTTYFRADTGGIFVTGNVNAGTGAHIGSSFRSTNQSGASTNSADTTFSSGQVSGATSNSGAVTLQSGASTTSGNTGSVTILSGNATSGNSGSITIDAGTATGTRGAINIGTANASAINMGSTSTSIATTVNGTVLIKSATGGDTTNTFNVQKANGDSMLKVDTANGLVVIGEDPDLTGARAKLLIGDTCGNDIDCVSIFEGPYIGSTVFDDSDTLQLQGAGGIRLSTSYSMTSRLVIDNSGQVGIGTEDPSEELTVVGNFNVQNAGALTKQFRFRTTGSALDFESGGSDLYISGWTAADYTGTQHTWIRGNLSLPATFVGDGIARDNPIKLVLSERGTSGDPGGYKGAMYYNSNTSRFRCYEGTEWKDCVSLVESHGTTNAGAAATTTSATYVNMPGTSSLAFTKKATSTKLVVTLNTSFWSTVNGTASRIAVRIDTTDYDCTNFYFNTANEHTQLSCTVVISGSAAGSKTLQARWRRVSGTGTLQMDTNDWTGITVIETN